MAGRTTVREGWTGPGRQDERIEVLPPADDGLHIDVGKRGQYEWWYFDAHLNSGHTVVVFFHAANPNPGLRGKTGIEVVLLRPDGRRVQRFFPHPRSSFSAARDKPEVSIGRSTLRVEQRPGELPVYEIVVEEPDLACRLTYRAEVNGWKPGTGLSHFGDLGYFGWVIPFARASVEGTIRDGAESLQVTGIGYHDHNWLNFPFQTVIDYWMWGRIYSDSLTASYAYIQCNAKVGGHTVRVLMVADGREVVLSTGQVEFRPDNYEYDARARYSFPRQLDLRAGSSFHAVLDVKDLLEAQDLLLTFSPPIRFVARHLLRLQPGYFRLVSDADLEVTHDGTTRRESGLALHEIVLFKPATRGQQPS